MVMGTLLLLAYGMGQDPGGATGARWNLLAGHFWSPNPPDNKIDSGSITEALALSLKGGWA